MYCRGVLFFRPERLVLGKDGRNRLCGYGTPDERGELTAIVDMRYLEADNEPEAEAGYAD
jgi:hypothetical protein